MPKRLKTLLGQVASFALAGGLLYLALRDVDFGEVAAALRSANYWWLIPLAALTIVSHLLRSWRWQILLYELPGARPQHPVSLYNAFSALIVGYFANYAAPRVGELVRAGLLARNEKLNVSGVVGTVVLERILDILVLILCVGITFFMLFDRFDVLRELLLDPIQVWWSAIPVYALVGGAVAILILSAAAVRSLRRSLRKSGKGSAFKRFVESFVAGMATLFRTQRTGAVIVSTILMWACYVVMTHMPFLVLRMTDTFDLTLMDSFYIMTLGAIGVAIPAPGGTGSYHYIAIQSLVLLFGVAQAPAATYAVLTHAAQLMLYAALATYFITSQKASIGEIRKLEHDAEEAIRNPTQ